MGIKERMRVQDEKEKRKLQEKQEQEERKKEALTRQYRDQLPQAEARQAELLDKLKEHGILAMIEEMTETESTYSRGENSTPETIDLSVARRPSPKPWCALILRPHLTERGVWKDEVTIIVYCCQK